ncbi:MAG: type II toxin-antitoxin system HigB family toxin, partial [Candidatus Melainabacteria bacterium]|nr:type II toxin-antitoxin system HigB family toxin [Candidatus Melainabacteria bacterium]
VKQTFASADLIGNNKWIFNISGNNYRLLAMVWMHNGIVHILKVMTHADCDKETFS